MRGGGRGVWGWDHNKQQLAQVINPSMTVHNGWLYVVATRYLGEWHTERSTYLGADVTERTLVRHTHVVSRKLPFNATAWLGWSAAAWGMDAEMVDVDVRASMAHDHPAAWQLCERKPLQLANATLLRTVTTGPVSPFFLLFPFTNPQFQGHWEGYLLIYLLFRQHPHLPLEIGRAVRLRAAGLMFLGEGQPRAFVLLCWPGRGLEHSYLTPRER
jgi:hypothetical protein